MENERQSGLTIIQINTIAAKRVVAGWFIGLAYFGWISPPPVQIAWWGYVLLWVVGMFVVSIVIGGGMSLLMAQITKITTGSTTGSPHFFVWAAFVSPVLAFFAAKLTIYFVASF